MSGTLSLLLRQAAILDLIFCLAVIGFYAWGVWCGLLLLEKQPGSERPCIIYWLMQVPVIGSPFLGYFFSGGFYLILSMQLYPVKFNTEFLLGSTFRCWIFQPSQPWLVGINIFAVAVIWVLMRCAR